jgi:hypothetical protein
VSDPIYREAGPLDLEPELYDTVTWPSAFSFGKSERLASIGWALVAYDSDGDRVHLGRYSLPALFEALVFKPDLPRCQLRIGIKSTGPACLRLTLVGSVPDPLTGARIRIPLDSLVREIATQIASAPAPGPSDTWEGFVQGFEAELANLARPERGKRISDEFLRQVADVYRYALGRGLAPTAAVGEAFNYSRSTAGRWIVEARRRGLLGPAIRGRAGEKEEL